MEITVTYRPQGYGQLRELMDLIEEARDAKISFEVLGEVVGERPEKRQRVVLRSGGRRKANLQPPVVGAVQGRSSGPCPRRPRK